MEEHVDDQDGGPPTREEAEDNNFTISHEEPRVPREPRVPKKRRCARACSRLTYIVLTLPFLAIAALTIVSVACFREVQAQVGDKCVLFGNIRKDNSGDLLEPGRNAVCLTVVCGELVLCALAMLCAIVLVCKAFFNSKPFTWFVIVEAFFFCLLLLVSIGISTTLSIGVNNTCSSINPGSPTPDKACATVKLNNGKYSLWSPLLQESMVASWLSSLMFLIILSYWIVLSLFTCCAINSRKKNNRACRDTNTERAPIMAEPNVNYGAT